MSAVDNRAMPESPLVGMRRKERTQLDDDISDVAWAALKELRARGYVVHAVEVVAHKNVREELGAMTVIGLPRVVA